MKKPQTTDVLRDLIARLQDHDVEMSKLRKVLDAQLIQLARLQAEVDALHSRESPDAPGSQQAIAPPRFTDRQEVLFSAARGLMWQP
jgi:uncharacterized membrane protein YccC